MLNLAKKPDKERYDLNLRPDWMPRMPDPRVFECNGFPVAVSAQHRIRGPLSDSGQDDSMRVSQTSAWKRQNANADEIRERSERVVRVGIEATVQLAASESFNPAFTILQASAKAQSLARVEPQRHRQVAPRSFR